MSKVDMKSEGSLELSAAYRKMTFEDGNGKEDKNLSFHAPEIGVGAGLKQPLIRDAFTPVGIQPFVDVGLSASITPAKAGEGESYKPGDCQSEFMGSCLDGAAGNYVGAKANGSHSSLILQAGVGTPIFGGIADFTIGAYAQPRFWNLNAMAPFEKYDAAGKPIKTEDGEVAAYTGMQTLKTGRPSLDGGLWLNQSVTVASSERIGSFALSLSEYLPIIGNVSYNVTTVGEDGSMSVTSGNSKTGGLAAKLSATWTFGGSQRNAIANFGEASTTQDVSEPKQPKERTKAPKEQKEKSRQKSDFDLSAYEGLTQEEKIIAIQEDSEFRSLMAKNGIVELAYAYDDESSKDMVFAQMDNGNVYDLVNQNIEGTDDVSDLITALLKNSEKTNDGKTAAWFKNLGDKIIFWDDKKESGAKKE